MALALVSWLSLPPVLLSMRRACSQTCLRLAWHWCVAAWVAWGVAGVAGRIVRMRDLPPMHEGTTLVLWYAVLVLLLVPPIAVLGARRPIHRVWNWFVLWPLLMVFWWPVLTLLAHSKSPAGWNLETPVAIGYALVLFMGAGNYLGTRFTIPALLWAAAAAQLLWPFASRVPPELAQITRHGDLACLFLALAGWLGLALRRGARQTPAEAATRLDRVWRDFRDAFGIVWARRVLDGFNELARQANASVRLGMRGVEFFSEPPASNRVAVRPFDAEKQLRWFLQKFVDAAWIDRRIPVADVSPRS